jgi:protein-tyrosine phosphatase
MIDLHAHFLHGIDDGAQTLSESLELARAAVADGITATAMTPHIHPGRFDNLKSHIVTHVAAFQLALQEAHIPLRVFPGAEVRLGVESLDQLLAGEVPFLGSVNGCQVLLLEFPHSHIPVGAQQFVNKLLSLNIRPLIAHPERNKSVMDDPRRIHPYVEAGCWLQLTAGSITGEFGTAAKKAALGLLDDDWAHLVATDAHNLSARPPKLSTARQAVAQRLGEDVAQLMFHTRPARILGLPLHG